MFVVLRNIFPVKDGEDSVRLENNDLLLAISKETGLLKSTLLKSTQKLLQTKLQFLM